MVGSGIFYRGVRRPLALMAATMLYVVLVSANSSAGAISQPTSLKGQVVAPDGNPLSQAKVRIGALVRRSLGDRATPDPLVGEGVADSQGWFSIPLTLTEELQRIARANDGRLNVEVFAWSYQAGGEESPSEGADASDARTSTLVGTTVGRAAGTAYKGVALAVGSSALALNTIGVGYGLALETPNIVKLQTWTLTARAQNDPEPCPSGEEAPQYYLTGSNDYFEPIGEFHAYEDVTGEFVYGKTADSEMGVGINWDAGPWKISGAVHVGNSSGQEIKYSRGPFYGRQLLTKFWFLHEEADWGCHHIKRIRADQWLPSALEGGDVSGDDGYYHLAEVRQSCGTRCVGEFAPGTGFATSAGRAVKYTAGVQAWGIQLSAQSGYSSYVRIAWNFGNEPWTHFLYGNNRIDVAPIIWSW